MENPVAIVKQAIQPGTILKAVLGALIVFAVIDLLGNFVFKQPYFLSYFMNPVTTLKMKFAPAASTPAA